MLVVGLLKLVSLELLIELIECDLARNLVIVQCLIVTGSTLLVRQYTIRTAQ